jgi:methyl acetate hydrolase
MDKLQHLLDQAVAQKDVPFVVAIVADKDKTLFAGQAGDAAPNRKAASDTLFRVFSMTKAIGATAAMILIDRGKLQLHTPVEEVLPAFQKLQVLERFENDQPVMRTPRAKATIRHLATHTSGLEYEFWNSDVAAYMQKTGHPTILTGLRASLNYPLMSEPGTRWGYGPSLDWLGLVVEAIDGRRIDRFCQEEIFEPLSMNDTSFEPPEAKLPRLASVFIRGEDGNFGPIEIAPPPHPEVYGMGHALYSTGPDYIRFLRMFLNRGALENQRILSENAVDEMLANQMNGLNFQKMPSASPLTAIVDPFPGFPVTHSFGFLRNETNIPRRRRAGSQSWAGVLNSHYWFDPKAGIAAVLMTQSLPFVEPPYITFYEAFETAVYDELPGYK